ncbi:protein phosphatase CheZ [Psychromonas sp. 14N.309.X.WAT.B.A12]|uniref:protein phosphatase CheZ n=1 Tax=unclassified Psychromonas TaxID=2614957 RepID=UPI0025B25A38|nr:protein phosphatase CheZ [Psychromonas sp. 14N.309.X.WAT.B.A12]MDN2662853.1 protein phosphatase CheZ [Psychromonas sp. 14N.309.X.WAT.B.A12]
MANNVMPHLSLSEAKALVAHLEADQIEDANKIVESVKHFNTTESVLFGQVGELTRELHEALLSFHNDTRLLDLAGHDLPDAKNRLNYVIEMTDKAANTTMDAIDHCLPVTDKLINDLDEVMPSWSNLMTRDLALGEFKLMCHSVDDFLNYSKQSANQLRDKLTEILMAQEFQDLTGQIINRVIELVQEIESKLVVILKVCSKQSELDSSVEKQSSVKETKNTIKTEGPIIDAESRTDVVNGQDDVDDLLSSLGF